MKANVILIAFAALVFIGIYILFPHTDMGKESYEANRTNAINYIMSTINIPDYYNDKEYQRELKSLIEKYDLREIINDKKGWIIFPLEGYESAQ